MDKLTKKSLSIFILLLATAMNSAHAEVMCEFDFFMDRNDNMEILKAHSYDGNLDSIFIPHSDYALSFFDYSGSLVESINFAVIFYLPDFGGEVDSIPLSIRAPCRKEWKEVKAFHQNRMIFTAQMSDLICNNDGACNSYENFLACNSDCPSGSKDGWCDRYADSVCDPDCLEGDPDCISSAIPPATESKNMEAISCNQNSVCELYENRENCPDDCGRNQMKGIQHSKTQPKQMKPIRPASMRSTVEKVSVGHFGFILVFLILLTLCLLMIMKERVRWKG